MSEAHRTTFELRPMGIGDILDTTLRLYRRNFASFLSISLITYVPYALVVFLLQMAFVGDPEIVQGPFGPQAMPDGAGALVNLLGTALLILIVYPLTTGALTHAIAGDFLGQRIGAGAAYSRAAGRTWALIGTQMLVGLVVFFGCVLLIVPGIIFSLWFMIVPAIVLLERLSGKKALERSRALMRGNLGKGFMLNLAVTVFVIVITYAVMFGVGFLIGMLQLPMAAAELFGNLLGAVFLPVQLAAIVLLYYDLRIRKEAFDLQILASSLPAQPSLA